MGFNLSPADHGRLQAALQVLLSPLDYPQLDHWRAEANRSVKDLLGADMVTFFLSAADGATPYSEEADLDNVRRLMPKRQVLWDARYRLDQREVALGVMNRDMMFHGFLREYYRSDYYHDHIVPYRAFDCVQMCVPTPNGTRAQLVLHHERPTGRKFGRRGLALLRLLFPAFKAGVQARLLGSREHQGLAHVLDSLREGVCLCERGGRVLHQNRTLTAMLGCRVDAAPLRAALDETVRALSRVCAGGFARSGAPDVLVRDVSSDQADYRVRGSLLHDPALGSEPGILVAVQSLTPPPPSQAAIRDAFRLTGQEARVAVLLARGRSNVEIAERLGISPHTARHHTESVLLKLGVRSRAEVEGRLVQGYKSVADMNWSVA